MKKPPSNFISKFDEFKDIIKKYENKIIGILIIGTPDPDSISSSLALSVLLTKYKVKSIIYRTEPIAASNNTRMINQLNITSIQEISSFEAIKGNIDGYAILDWSNPDIGINVPCIIHIDHHNLKPSDIKPEFQYINTDIKSVASIFASWFEIDDFLETWDDSNRLATALSYGIYSDTKELRNANCDDYMAMAYLNSYLDMKEFMSISRVSISKTALKNLQYGIDPMKENMNIYGSVLVCFCGIINETKQDESLAIIADQIFMCIQNVNTTITWGILQPLNKEPYIRGSIRNLDSTFDFERILKTIGPNSGRKEFEGGFIINLGPLSHQMAVTELIEHSKRFINSTLKGILEIDDTAKNE